MYPSIMRILLTGATGMLGGSIADELVHHTKALEILAPTNLELNLSDKEVTDKYLQQLRPEIIIHCAAKVGGIQANVKDPWEFFYSNHRIDSNLIGAAFSAQIRSFFYFGSSCMYPAITAQPMSEAQLFSGKLESTNEGYAIAKLTGTKLVEAAATQFGLDWHAFILSNLYGPRDNFNQESSHLVAAIINKIDAALKSNDVAVEMWGDGNARREFTFVHDISKFIVSRIGNSIDLPKVLNLGFSRDYSIIEYYQEVAKVMQFSGSIRAIPDKPSGMQRKLMDSSLASSFGWSPSTELETGLSVTIDYFKSRGSK
jgi:GDP-L-fucose synthase